MKKIEAKIVADSISQQGHRITSYILTYPRFIHSELMTHRMFSRNSASSRAIPFKKMVQMVEEDPFIPIAWQKDHKGMQGSEYITERGIIELKNQQWINARNQSINFATELNRNVLSSTENKTIENSGVTKQLCNRLLEPFMWHTVLVTATKWDNFFELRCPRYQYKKDFKGTFENAELIERRSKKDLINAVAGLDPSHEIYSWDQLNWLTNNVSQAEIHIQALAEAMWDAMSESIPKELKAGEWHIPFGDRIDNLQLAESIGFKTTDYDWYMKELWSKIQISTARCARLSYMTFDNEIDYEKDIKLHDHLLESKHMSPFEHCARVMSDDEYYSFIKGEYPIIKEDDGEIVNRELYPQACGNYNYLYGWCNNFRGWVQYRYLVENT